MVMSAEEWCALQRNERRADLVARKEAITPVLRAGVIWPFPARVERLSRDVVSNAVLGKAPNKRGARLYLLEFRGSAQYVKAGSVGDDYEYRVKGHCRIARVHGYALVDAWFSHHVADARRLEAALKILLRLNHDRHDGEYFHGLDFERAMECAEAIVRFQGGGT
ncbi:hypothetical protein [Streptomyces odontomachi]|uniref:hypothetical protein n=1 Tax=Streptomyces odontomachi TaxID=2944940 RepID=UPI00210DE0FE|nr:hypothetical protein [Streptomyces sp. ODS25]